MYEAVQVVNPVEPQVQNKTQNHPVLKSSGDKKKLANENAPESLAKYMRFELEYENGTNGWNLLSGLVSYLHKKCLYMSLKRILMIKF